MTTICGLQRDGFSSRRAWKIQTESDVTALHNHMLDDQPRVFFMHFWANDNAARLAKGLKAALDKVNVAKKLAQK